MIERTHPHYPLVCTDAAAAASSPHTLPTDDRAMLVGALIAQAVGYTGPRTLTLRLAADHVLRADGETLADCVASARPVTTESADLRVIVDPELGAAALEFVFDGRSGLVVRCASEPRDPAALDRIALHYLAFLRTTMATPDIAVRDVDCRTDAERDLVVSLNDTNRMLAFPQCIHHLVEAAVLRDPDAVAVIRGDARLSFGELNALADAVADRLAERGVGPGARVGVLATRGVEFVVCALGALKSGAAYVPLDPTQPEQRLRSLFRLGDVVTLLVEDAYRDVAASLTDGWSAVPPYPAPAGQSRPVATGLDLAYVIFTSGSSGEPKGSLLDHIGRVNMIVDLDARFAIGPGDRMLVVSSPSFDMSVYDVFGILAAGATVVLPAVGREYDVDHWAELIVAECVTLWHSVPSALTLLLNALPVDADTRSMRLFLLGGDWIPVEQPARVHARFPGAEFYSLGGATEVSVDSVIYRVAPGERHARAIPYGRPLANQTAHIVAWHGRDAGIDQIGELVLGGIGVGWGYSGRPDLTAERFVLDPNSDRPGARAYRTGDAARLRADGEIELLGRLDQQVKIEGVRIELGEVQAALAVDDRVRQAAVVARRDENGRAVALVGFVVVDPAVAEPDAVVTELPDRLRATLHRAMVPAEIRRIAEIPLNANGKVDRRALEAGAVADRVATAPSVVDEYTDAVAEVWAQVLGLTASPGSDARFLALGGGSLAATQVVNRLSRRFDAELSVRDVMTTGTVAEIAGLLRTRAGTRRRTGIRRVHRG